jgi:hypothetical protein
MALAESHQKYPQADNNCCQQVERTHPTATAEVVLGDIDIAIAEFFN